MALNGPEKLPLSQATETIWIENWDWKAIPAGFDNTLITMKQKWSCLIMNLLNEKKHVYQDKSQLSIMLNLWNSNSIDFWWRHFVNKLSLLSTKICLRKPSFYKQINWLFLGRKGDLWFDFKINNRARRTFGQSGRSLVYIYMFWSHNPSLFNAQMLV